jgi:hypothetical protein
MEDIASDTAPFINDPPTTLGMELQVSLQRSVNLLIHNDLDNYLEPLATHLSHGRLVSARATKEHGMDQP